MQNKEELQQCLNQNATNKTQSKPQSSQDYSLTNESDNCSPYKNKNLQEVSISDFQEDSQTILEKGWCQDSIVSFLSSSGHQDLQKVDKKAKQNNNQLQTYPSVETQFSTFQPCSLDNFDLSQQNSIQKLSTMYNSINTNYSFLNNLKASQLQNFKLTNQEGESLIQQMNDQDEEETIQSDQIWNRQKGLKDFEQNLILEDLEEETNLNLANQNGKQTVSEKCLFKKKQDFKKNKKILENKDVESGHIDNQFFTDNQIRKKNKKHHQNKKQNSKKCLKSKNKNKNDQKQKYINFVFENISLDIYFHLNKAYLNGIEADMVFKQNAKCFKLPKYKHQETLYIECQMKLKKNIFGKKTLNCKIYRRNKYISKAVVNNNIYYRNEGTNFLKKMDNLFNDFFKMHFQIKNFQITLSFNRQTVLITELDQFALSKGVLKTRNQYVGEFQQQHQFDKTVLKVASLYQQQIYDHYQYFVSKYFVYDIILDSQGNMFIDSTIVQGQAKQIFG